MDMLPRAALFRATRRLQSTSASGVRTTFALNDLEGLPNVVTGKRIDATAADAQQEAETWRLLKRAMDEKQEVYARVLQKTDRGYLLDILGRVAFLPTALAGNRAPLPKVAAAARTQVEEP